MLLSSLDADSRLTSPDNLINRLRGISSSYSQQNKVIDVTPISSVNDEESNENELNENELAVVESVLESEGLVEHSSRKTPKLDDLVPDALDKIKINLAQATALDVIQTSLDDLRMRMGEIDKPEKLARIATDASKVINNLRPKEESGPTRGSVIIYKPIVANIADYRTVKAVE